jgi:hypothetical protein
VGLSIFWDVSDCWELIETRRGVQTKRFLDQRHESRGSENSREYVDACHKIESKEFQRLGHATYPFQMLTDLRGPCGYCTSIDNSQTARSGSPEGVGAQSCEASSLNSPPALIKKCKPKSVRMVSLRLIRYQASSSKIY